MLQVMPVFDVVVLYLNTFAVLEIKRLGVFFKLLILLHSPSLK